MQRKLSQPHLVPVNDPTILLARDVDQMRLNTWLRREMWNFLLEVGLVSAPEPAPPPRRANTKLSVVANKPEENEPGQGQA